MNIVPALIVLFTCQLAGTAVQQTFSLPIPGTVAALLFDGNSWINGQRIEVSGGVNL
ncbi:MAG: hypothetical protein KGJ79_07090 [Alphaproteobacteria bacterium]|nr:hypothetical protein [Alphaproteobacteria bacterium]MDE2494119.1 hypothetical protein [Alphaproteobacteria bacterium]MDE2500647.1 hypothetical protein [Alphaproteobacteria bacterium]